MGLFSEYGETHPAIWHVILVSALVMSAFLINSLGFNEVRFVDYTQEHGENKIAELEKSLETKKERISELEKIQPINYSPAIMLCGLLAFLGLGMYVLNTGEMEKDKNRNELAIAENKKEEQAEIRKTKEAVIILRARKEEIKEKKKKEAKKYRGRSK